MEAVFEKLRVEIYGESHAPEIGVRIYGLPSGCVLSLRCVNNLLERRRSRGEAWATPRKESDTPEIVKGLSACGNGYMVDGTVELRIKNLNIRAKDYDNVIKAPRPSHADYVAYCRNGKISSGGGRFSGRMTAPLCIAGGIAQELLEEAGIRVCAYISEIGDIKARSYKDDINLALEGICEEDEKRIKSASFPLADETFAERMQEQIKIAAKDGDSVGGVIECIVSGMEAGMLGDALFDGLEGKIAYSVYAIPAVKGVEFGSGFDLAKMRGSEANDGYDIKDGKIVTVKNNSGGINGGISNGMPVLIRVAVKPTPSISKTQPSVDIDNMEKTALEINGRHDACIVPRAVPCVESAVSLAILDELLKLRSGIELYNAKTQDKY